MRTRGRLGVRIYLFSLLCVGGAVALILMVLAYVEPAMRASGESPPEEAMQMFEARADAPRLAALIDAAARADHRVTVYAVDGTLIAASGPPIAPLSAAQVAKLGQQGVLRLGKGQFANALLADGKLVAYGEVALAPPAIPRTLLLGVVAVVSLLLMGVSLLFARSLARPLRTLAHAASAFGAGDLDARTRLAGTDELGAAGAAFDGMADHLTTLMRSQQEMMGNVAHELRTPIARIRVALELAGEGDAATAREVLADIDADLGDLERLVDDVLTSVRLDLAAPLHRDPLPPAELLTAAAERARGGRPRNPILVDAPAGLPPITGDAALLRRVFGNLVDNAQKYSDAGTPITLRAGRVGDRVRFEVIDRGMGIDEADLASVFDPFFRTDRSRARATGGVGLGLSIARKIVVAHGGEIALTSRPGLGTTVTVALPIAPPEAP